MIPANPCIPSPCGPFAQCQLNGQLASCSCLSNYIGSPPNCRPECTSSSDCPSNLACINERCRDPCPGACGISAHCNVFNHNPICACDLNYIGNPFTVCHPPPKENLRKLLFIQRIKLCIEIIVYSTAAIRDDPCNPSPCGSNSQCNNGVCTCISEYHGDPYRGCTPECVLNSDCPRNRACIRHTCVDPCPGSCGQNAVCDVVNHIPMCNCPPNLTGNAFVRCHVAESMAKKTALIMKMLFN